MSDTVLLQVAYRPRDIDCMHVSAGDIWICKPTGLNQGRGIFLIRDLEEFRSTYLEQEFPDIGRRPKHPGDKIVQRLLIRSFAIIVFHECLINCKHQYHIGLLPYFRHLFWDFNCIIRCVRRLCFSVILRYVHVS